MDPKPGKLYLIPCPISQGVLFTLPAYIREKVQTLTCFFAENERTARRFLKSLDPAIRIDALEFHLIDGKTAPDFSAAKRILLSGKDIGLISEAGCPAVADPGSALVALAHTLEVTVLPLVGPSSILLALMGSGMNGQHFRFVGYLPVKAPERIKMIRELEQQSRKVQQTQIFIETPYRNRQLIADLLDHCQAQTLLCVAADLTGPEEFIRTRTIGQWKLNPPGFEKIPAIYLLYAGHQDPTLQFAG